MATEAINSINADTFDTHEIERRILRLHTHAVANELLRYDGQGLEILNKFSAQFARWIDKEFEEEIRQTQKVTTDNLGGRPSSNQQWTKRNPGTEIL
jgi:hypothetical protein